MKKLLCVLLSLAMLMTAVGCSFGSQEEPEDLPAIEKMQTDFNTRGVITGDAVPCYSDRNDLLYSQIGTVYSGDHVKIHYREIAGGENWVFTDRGWIYGDYVQTLDDRDVSAANGYACVDTVAAIEPHRRSTVVRNIAQGEMLLIDALIPGEDGMWGATAEGWVPMCDVILDDVGVNGMVGMELVTDVTQRAGPGVEFDAMGVAAPGLVLITDIAETHGILWGQVDSVVWICLDFVELPGMMKLTRTDGTLFTPDRYRDPLAYYGQTSQEQTGQEQPGGNQGSMTQTPNNTALVGDWVRFDENAFLQYGSVSGEGWSFRADGSFQSSGCEYAYFADRGGWYGASGGWGSEGIFTYDGATLNLQINTYFEPDPDASPDPGVQLRTYPCTVSGNYAYWDSSYYRADDVNDAIRDCVRSNAASRVEQALVGVWQDSNGQRLELRSDGTFTASDGSGKFVHCGSNLCMVYANDHIGNWNIRLDGDRMIASYMQEWTFVEVIFTRG